MRRELQSPVALRAFEAAARHLSFSRAADELFVTPSAVSHQVRGLENSLGVRLFVRLTRALSLTESGERLAHVLRDSFDRIEGVLNELRSESDTSALRIGLTSYFAARWLTRRLSEFAADHPGIEIHLRLSNEDIDWRRSELDLAIAWGMGEWSDVEAIMLMPLELIVVCSPKLLARGERLDELPDLCQFTRLHETNHNPWQHFLASVGHANLGAVRNVVMDDPNVLHQACIEGQGVALGAKSLLIDELAQGTLIQPFADVVRYGGYYIVSPSDRLQHASVRAFRDWMLDAESALGG